MRAEYVTGQGNALRYTQTSPSTTVLHWTSRVNDTRDWTQVYTTFTTPSTHVNGRVDILMDLNSSDVALIDDVSICEGIGPCQRPITSDPSLEKRPDSAA